MKIEVERSGGFAGIIKTAKIDTENLTKSEVDKIKSMLKKCNFHANKKTDVNNNLPRVQQIIMSIEFQ